MALISQMGGTRKLCVNLFILWMGGVFVSDNIPVYSIWENIGTQRE